MVQKRKFLMLSCVLLASSGLAAANEKLLYRHLMEDYEPAVRPVKNQTTTTIVNMTAVLQNLIDVIESSETIKINLVLTLYWTDEYLTWDPTEFDNITGIMIPANKIWLPDLIVITSIEVVDIMSPEELRVYIDYTGSVTFSKSQVIDNYCAMKIEQFPYDEQQCPITLSPMYYPTYWQELHNLPSDASVPGNSEWIPLALDFEREEFVVNGWTVVHLNYVLKIKRRPAYYVWVLIVPTFIITALCITGIFTPTNSNGERGEKVTIGLSTLLAVAVILNIAAAEMPKAEELPKLGIFVMLEIVICALCLVIAVAIMELHYRTMRQLYEPPYRLTAMLLLPTKCENSKVIDTFESPKLKRIYLPWKKAGNADSLGLGGMLMELKQSVADIRAGLQRKEKEDELIDEWTAVFDRIDLILFVIFQIGNVIVFVTNLG